MPRTPPTHVLDATESADRVRDALSVMPSAVEDDVREELTPYPPQDREDQRPVAPSR